MKIINKSILSEVIDIFSKQDKKKILIVVIAQSFLSFLDLAGVAIIGVLAALAVTGISAGVPGTRVGMALRILNIDDFEFQQQVAILGVIASLLLIFRSLMSIYLMKRILLFISKTGARISSQLLSRLTSKSLFEIEKYTEQEILYGLTSGVQVLTLGVVGSLIMLTSDITLLLILMIGISAIDPLMSLLILLIFGILGISMYLLLHKRASKIGTDEVTYGIASNQKIVELFRLFREIFVQNRRSQYILDISELRFRLAKFQAEKAFLPNISKYIIESAVVIGALAIGALQFALQDSRHAIASLSIFLVAGTRIAPAVLRIQQALITVKSSLASSGKTLEMIAEFRTEQVSFSKNTGPLFKYPEFVPEIHLNNVKFSYAEEEMSIISGITTKITAGEFVAIVGSSGAGKSTLLDLLLGIYNPKEGEIYISGKLPIQAIEKWPGSISYVPQNITLAIGTIKDNISFGLETIFPDSYYWEALKLANLDHFVSLLPNKLDEMIEDNGKNLSGGQRQRLGIARALFSKPRLLILDEATSSLDVDDENSFTNTLLRLKGETTIIVIAHRLSSVRNADRLFFMKSGKFVSEGNFEELKKQVPDFERQTGLLGL